MQRRERNSKRFILALLLATALIEAPVGRCATAQDAPHWKGRRVGVGVWGGPDLEMRVTQQGAELEFDCGQGTIVEPLVLDEAGKFQVRGTFRSQPGPARKGQPSRGIDVVYAGTVRGDTMHLELADDQSPETFTLVRGQEGNLRRCH
jgi:hypothetical protein